MIEAGFNGFVGTEAVRFSRGQFDFVVESFDGSAGKLALGSKSVENQLSMVAQCAGNLLRRAVTAFLENYHAVRNHLGLDNLIIEPNDEVGSVTDTIKSRERLGGLLKYYYHDAA